MMFSIPLMCCEYRDVLLLTSVHPSQRAPELWDSVFTGSKDALCIQPSVLELSVNAKICDPCPICRMVIYMVATNTRNSRRFNVRFPLHAVGILHLHARPFSLYPPMP